MTGSWNLKSISQEFEVKGEFLSAQPYGNGHLHDTFLVKMKRQPGPVAYIFQRINHTAFRNPPALMENISRVTRFLRQKLETLYFINHDISRHVLTVIPTKDGENLYKDSDGNYWRAYLFIEKAKAYDTLHSLDQAYQAAFMFGQFLKRLEDFPPPPLHETIANFHNGPERFKEFQQALTSDSLNRAKTARAEIDFLSSHAGLFAVIPDLVQKKKIPLRVTHNDTKINNVLLDETTGAGVCVIDLDTVMNGVSLYDFGDLARSTLSSLEEDERDLTNLVVEMPRFEAIIKGFLAGAAGSLTRSERDYLVFSTQLMPLLIGMRFLSDYLRGDIYFKVRRHSHNLDRCRRQFKLVQAVKNHETEMLSIVQKGGGTPDQ
jgi:aminoglycoside phosphotransferase (APT) family kinase protein